MVRNTQLESMAVAQTAAGRMVVAGVKPAAKICRRIKADVKQFLAEEDGMGVVEIVLIIIVLIGLVIVFKSQITALVNKLLSKAWILHMMDIYKYTYQMCSIIAIIT